MTFDEVFLGINEGGINEFLFVTMCTNKSTNICNNEIEGDTSNANEAHTVGFLLRINHTRAFH